MPQNEQKFEKSYNCKLSKLQIYSVATMAFGTAAREITEDLARELEESTTSDFPFSRQYSTVRRRNMQQVNKIPADPKKLSARLSDFHQNLQ